jgi:hypothetical protein
LVIVAYSGFGEEEAEEEEEEEEGIFFTAEEGLWGVEEEGLWGGWGVAAASLAASLRHGGGRAILAVPCPGAGAAIGRKEPVTGSMAANPSNGSPGVFPGC